MGDSDPDFSDPKAEAGWIAATLHGSAVIVPQAGHYPQSQQPAATLDAMVGFLRTLGDHA